MTIQELIAELEKAYLCHGDLPVIMTTCSGSGEIAGVVVGFDTVERRQEVWLRETP